jgi:hypothetical protein
MIDRAWLGLRSALLRRRLEREMQEEMQQHLERSTERLMARGLSPRAARRAAEREFGNVAWLQDQARDARGTAWLDAVIGDVRFALRHFRRRPVTFALRGLRGGVGTRQARGGSGPGDHAVGRVNGVLPGSLQSPAGAGANPVDAAAGVSARGRSCAGVVMNEKRSSFV